MQLAHTVSATDPFTAIVLVACAIVAVSMVGLVVVAIAAVTGRSD